MIKSTFATDEQKLLTQLLPYDETDPINVINLYQILDQSAPRLNQLFAADLKKHLTELESNFGGSLSSIFKLQKHDHVQLIDADNNYYQFLNQQANVKNPAKELIIKNNKSDDQKDFIKSVTVSKQLDQLFIATEADQTDYNTADPLKDHISQLHFEFIAVSKATNQLMPEFNQQLVLDLNQWTSGQLVDQLLKFKYQLQTNIKQHNLVYVGHNTDQLSIADNRICKLSYLIQYFTGVQNENNTYFSYAYGIYNKENSQLIYTMLDSQVAYNESINATKARYSSSQACKNQETLIDHFLIKKVFKNEESYQTALKVIAKKRSYADQAHDLTELNAIKAAIAKLNSLVNDQFSIKLLIGVETERDAYKEMAESHHFENEYQKFDQDVYESSHRQLYYADNNLNCNIYTDDPAVAKEYALTFFLYNYQAVAQHLSISEQFAQPIIKMIYAQQDLFQPQFTKTAEPQEDTAALMLNHFNPSMQEFLQNLHFDTQKNHSNTQIQLIDILNYIYAVKHHQAITPKMLELLVSNSNQATNDQIAINEAYNAKIFDKLHKLNNWKTLPTLQKLSLKDRVVNVYTIDQAKPEKAVNVTPVKSSHQVTLVHGTQNFSLISILEKGLLTHHDLIDDNNKHYQYTGSALGDGVYFSRLDQAEKSANYTDAYRNDTNSFLFIADVNYDQIHEVNNYSDQPLQPHENLVWAHGVGSYDRDELVATDKDQVTLRYLVEIKPAN